MQLIHLITTNDSNGNSRRAWAEYNDHGIITAFHIEGCAGYEALPEHLRPLRLTAPTITVAPKEWNNWRKAAKENA